MKDFITAGLLVCGLIMLTGEDWWAAWLGVSLLLAAIMIYFAKEDNDTSI